jgi:hypothetical protein
MLSIRKLKAVGPSSDTGCIASTVSEDTVSVVHPRRVFLAIPKSHFQITKVMVKTTSSPPFEHQRFALHIGQFSRRFVVRPRKSRPAILCCGSPKSSSSYHFTIQDWTADLDLSEQNVDMKCQDSSKDKMAIENILVDPTPIVHVPQDIWDELFDKALLALNTVPVDEDPKI